MLFFSFTLLVQLVFLFNGLYGLLNLGLILDVLIGVHLVGSIHLRVDDSVAVVIEPTYSH